MNIISFRGDPGPDVAVERLIERHGLAAVLRAVVGQALRRNPARRSGAADTLSDHLRRDIGLPPVPEGRKYWELR